MVVHDLRNPTNQVDFLVSQTLNILKNIKFNFLPDKVIEENIVNQVLVNLS